MAASQQLYADALRLIPGGVNSPVHAFRGVGGNPVFFERGHGAYLVDVNGKEYVDYISSWGPLIAGHAHPYVVEKIIEAVRKGCSFGAPTPGAVKLAEKVQEFMPNLECMRFVNSGTEATMSAIRIARGYTKRDKFIKFAGCYHGHADSLLVAAGSGILTLGIPSSAGVPKSFVEHTLVAEFNDLNQVRAYFEKYPEEIACIIVEPVAGNMNCILPQPGFLQGLRDLCDQYGSVLIFDEVMTGFRVAKGGAQAHYQVKPDLTALGKVIGGGFPVGAFGGKKEIMSTVAPLGPVYQAGTLSGNPVAMAAGLATLELASAPGFYEKLTATTLAIMQGFEACAKQSGIPFHTVAIGGMFGIFFADEPGIHSEADTRRCHVERFKQFFHLMLNEGVYLAPSAFEAGFVSAAHDQEAVQKTLAAAASAFAHLPK